MSPFKPGAIRPTPEEDAAINAAIASDPDAFELTDKELAGLRPMTEADPELVARYRAEKARKGRKVS